MTSTQHRALLCLERLRALIEQANLPDMEVKGLATEINELFERHIAPEVRPQEATKATQHRYLCAAIPTYAANINQNA